MENGKNESNICISSTAITSIGNGGLTNDEDQDDLTSSSMIPPPMNVIKAEQSEQV